MTLDRRRLTSSSCTCNSNPNWCQHVVAVCLHRIRRPNSVCLRAPVSESLSRLQRDQLQKFAQYLISELPRQVLPTAQKLLDELLGQATPINALCGAPDPTAGASIQEEARWCLDEPRLHENIRKILVKFCIPAPQVLSDVNYLSSTAPPAASEWHCMIGALVGRRPEGLWNLLDMVREMSRRHDYNAVRLLHILTQQALSCEQVLLWWYGTKLSQSLIGPQLLVSSKSSFGNTASAQYSCSLLCDEMVTLWRMAAMNPGLSPAERSQLRNHLKQYHLQVVERVSKTLESGEGNASRLINRLPLEHCRFTLETFAGFRTAIEACFLTWDDCQLPGITYQAPIIAQCQVRVGDSTFSPSDASLISPLSQGALSPSLPVLRDKQYRTFSQLKKANSAAAAAASASAEDRLSQDDSANSSSDESGQDSADPPSSGGTLVNVDFGYERRPVSNVNGKVRASPPVDEIDRLYLFDAGPENENPGPPTPKAEKKHPMQVASELLEQLHATNDPFEVKFARAEALHIHGYFKEACCLCIELANDLMLNPPRLIAEVVSHSTPQIHLTPTKLGHVGAKKKRRSQDVLVFVHPKAAEVTHLAATTLSRAVFLCQVLLQDCGTRHLAFRLALFVLELPRQPAATKLFEVKMHHLESLLVGIIRRIRWGAAEMNLFRERAARLKSPHQQSSAVMPWNLANLVFQALSGATDGEQTDLAALRQPGDEQLGFDAAAAALGWRFAVSEIEHPLLCEGLRRMRGELAMNLLIRYKDHHERLALTMDRLLDLQMHQMYRHYSSNASYYGGACSLHPANHPHFEQRTVSNNLNNNNNTGHQLGSDNANAGVNTAAGCSLQRSVSGVSMNSCSNGDESEDSFLNMEEIPESDNSPMDENRTLAGSLVAPRLYRESSDASDVLNSPIRASSPPAAIPKNLDSAAHCFKLSKNRRHLCPTGPNQPSEAAAHFMFELAKTVLLKAGGTHSTAIFSAGTAAGPSNNQAANGAGGPHRSLHLCAFQIGLYALGLHNRVSPNWLSRTYSSHVSWISGQAMELGRVALKILIDTWEQHLTPTEVANLADKASQGRDAGMVQAAADLALSALPHAHALNPTEIQRALVQCREQNTAMLEKACLAVENAARDGGVYPEVLFLVANQWYKLYLESGGSDHIDNNGVHNGGDNPPVLQQQPQQHHQPMQQQSPILPPPPLMQPMVAPPQMPLPMPLQFPPAIFPQPFFSAAGPTGQLPYPPVSAAAFGFPPSTSAGAAGFLQAPVGLPFPPPQLAANFVAGGPLYFGQHLSPNAVRMHLSQSAPNLGPGQHPGGQQVHVPPAPPANHDHHQGQTRYLYAAYRVGMLAMETMGRRIHDDNRNYVKYAQNPPYGDDVKWLFRIAKKLGFSHVQQFCHAAAQSVVSPFILYDLACESAQVLARGTTPLAKALMHSQVQPLMTRCLQMFYQAAHQKLSHPRFTPSDAEELLTLVKAARTAFNQSPGGQLHFSEFLQSLRRQKACKKELWGRLMNALST